ncbi:amidohydrolase [Trebonia kvetii]|uniref:Amidohydrolase n=1 Tax=Trebonia kvetii TaxID=2480626 RepID=A0A6P2BUB8_9ACTN|nr:amidohydrolase family protein [Trebonia kvetii]TVZ02682.1 amidohydrolase [Trebonia kvetii]
MTVIDAHHHVWDLAVRDQPWLDGDAMAPIRRRFTVDDLRPDARAAGVGATVLVQTVTVAEETPEMLALAGGDPLVAGVVGWTDLTSQAIADELARLTAGPGGEHLVGIRHQVQSEPDPDWLRRPDVIRGLRAVAAAGLCYDLVVLPHQIPAASYAAAVVPGLTLVLDHAGKPRIDGGDLGAWQAAVREFAGLPNTACKLSGLVTEAPAGAAPSAFAVVADAVLDAFGAGRVMFGSDWPVCLLVSDYAGVFGLARSLTAGLSAAEQAAVFGGTAARAYRLAERAGAAGAGEGHSEAGAGPWH